MQQINNYDTTPQAVILNNSGGMPINYGQPIQPYMNHSQPMGQPMAYDNNLFLAQNQYARYPQQNGPIYIQNM